MTFQEFDDLLQRYINGKCTPEESARIEKWYASYDAEMPDILPAHQKIIVEKKLCNAITKTRTLPAKRRFLVPVLSGVAASLVLLVMSIWWVKDELKLPSTQTQSVIKSETSVIVNNSANTLSETLTDGSTITLQPGSEIRYNPIEFATSRELTLTGEAFFEVRKDSQHPFLVYTGGLVTKVLGTSFTISERKDLKEIVVSVKTGKVSVFPKNVSPPKKEPKQEVILTPNQKAIYDTFSDEVVIGRINEAQKSEIKESSKIHFSNTAATEIFQALQDNYGVKIEFEEGNLEACRITTTLANESLFQKLDIICQAIGADYRVVDGSVLITGGCN